MKSKNKASSRTSSLVADAMKKQLKNIDDLLKELSNEIKKTKEVKVEYEGK